MIIINVNNNPTIAMQIPFVWLGQVRFMYCSSYLPKSGLTLYRQPCLLVRRTNSIICFVPRVTQWALQGCRYYTMHETSLPLILSQHRPTSPLYCDLSQKMTQCNFFLSSNNKLRHLSYSQCWMVDVVVVVVVFDVSLLKPLKLESKKDRDSVIRR